MKNLPKSFLAVLATALLTCTLISQHAQAVPVTGNVRFAGTTIVNPARTTFVSFSSVFVQQGPLAASGDFAGSQGSPVQMTGFQYNPFTAPVTPLWSFMFNGTNFSFDLLTSTTLMNTPNFISIQGTGILFASGALNRDPTPGIFTLTATNTDGGFDFGFASDTQAAAAIPEGGSALALLGIALVGVEALRRKLAAR